MSILKETTSKFERVPMEARQAIEKSIQSNVQAFRESINKHNEGLHHEILSLKDQLVKANEDRLTNEREINELNGKIRQHRIFEDVKRKELEMMLFDRQNKYYGGNKVRTEIPESAPKKFQFPEMPRNYEQRLKNKVANKVMVEAPMLYSKTSQIKVQKGAVAQKDYFDDNKVSEALIDRQRVRHAEFYAVEKQAVRLPESFPNIEDDHTNKQNIIVPRFKSDMMDDDRHLIDIFSNNEDRLKALDSFNRPTPASFAGGVGKEKVDFEKVDKIIDALDAFKVKYFDDKQQERIFKDVSMDEKQPVQQ